MTEQRDAPVCPYCGYVTRDEWEIGSHETEIECCRCNKTFGIEQEISRTFVSYKIANTKEAQRDE